MTSTSATTGLHRHGAHPEQHCRLEGPHLDQRHWVVAPTLCKLWLRLRVKPKRDDGVGSVSAGVAVIVTGEPRIGGLSGLGPQSVNPPGDVLGSLNHDDHAVAILHTKSVPGLIHSETTWHHNNQLSTRDVSTCRALHHTIKTTRGTTSTRRESAHAGGDRPRPRIHCSHHPQLHVALLLTKCVTKFRNPDQAGGTARPCGVGRAAWLSRTSRPTHAVAVAVARIELTSRICKRLIISLDSDSTDPSTSPLHPHHARPQVHPVSAHASSHTRQQSRQSSGPNRLHCMTGKCTQDMHS